MTGPGKTADRPAQAAVAGLGTPKPKNLGHSIFKNATLQIVGRNLIALLRLVLASLVLRRLGKEMFAEYSLLLVLITISEWVLDFGTTDVFVRDVCADAGNGPKLLRTLTAAKIPQFGAAFTVLILMVICLGYPWRIVSATLVAGLGMLFMAGICIYRVAFRSTLRMGYEVYAELLSVVVMIPLILWIAHTHGGLIEIAACHLASRAAFFMGCRWLDREGFRFSIAGVTKSEVKQALRASWAIGAIGFLVVVYETMDVLLLSRFSTLSEVAAYSGAQRYVLPILMSLTAVGSVFYPVMSSFWPKSPREFETSFQRGLDSIMLLTGAAVCGLLAGAEFLMRLLGPELLAAAPVLRVLALVCIAKAVSSAIGPALYVVRREQLALKLVAITVALKAGMVVLLAHSSGSFGVAWAALAADTFSAICSVVVIQRATGYRVRWQTPVKVTAIAVVVALTARYFVRSEIAGLALSCLAYCGLVVASGALAAADIRKLLLRRKSVAAGAS